MFLGRALHNARKVCLIFTCALFILMVLQGSENAYALLVKMSLEELSSKADSIIVGQVTDMRSQWEDRNIFTYVTLSVEQYIKGAGDSQVTIKTLGGTVGNLGQRVSDTPSFHIDERAVLFLRDEFFRVVGWRQGKFSIIDGEVVVDNAVLQEFDFIDRIRYILGMPELGGVRFKDLAPWDRRMAVSETLAHLEAMRVDDRVVKFPRDSIIYYQHT